MRANAWEGIGKEVKIKCKFYVSSHDVRIVCPRLNILMIERESAGIMARIHVTSCESREGHTSGKVPAKQTGGGDSLFILSVTQLQ
jgi:hypothetical protein